MFLVYITKKLDKYKRVIPEKVIGGRKDLNTDNMTTFDNVKFLFLIVLVVGLVKKVPSIPSQVFFSGIALYHTYKKKL